MNFFFKHKSGLLFIILIALTVLSSCKKEGPGGDGEISFTVKHHGTLIPGATVYIKYGATEFPGKDVSVYDDAVTTNSDGDNRATGSFGELRKGDYYLFATGFDSTIILPVSGGVGVGLERNGDLVETDIPVTEDH